MHSVSSGGKYQTPLQLCQEQYPTTTEFITASLYVDDLISNVDNVQAAKTLHEEANAIFKGAGVRL